MVSGMTPTEKLAAAIAAATIMLIAVTLIIDSDERRRLAAWWRWRMRRPMVGSFDDWPRFHAALALWKEQRP